MGGDEKILGGGLEKLRSPLLLHLMNNLFKIINLTLYSVESFHLLDGNSRSFI